MDNITNLFDFIDYLEGFNRISGTANDNRAFVFDTLEAGINASDNPLDLLSAYESVGISVPESAFNNIFDFVSENRGGGSLIELLAPTSPIPSDDLEVFNGRELDSNYIVYYDVSFVNAITGDINTSHQFLKFDDEFTPSQLRQEAITDFQTRYKTTVSRLDLKRIYTAGA